MTLKYCMHAGALDHHRHAGRCGHGLNLSVDVGKGIKEQKEQERQKKCQEAQQGSRDNQFSLGHTHQPDAELATQRR
jgi:hypothetical protein